MLAARAMPLRRSGKTAQTWAIFRQIPILYYYTNIPRMSQVPRNGKSTGPRGSPQKDRAAAKKSTARPPDAPLGEGVRITIGAANAARRFWLFRKANPSGAAAGAIPEATGTPRSVRRPFSE